MVATQYLKEFTSKDASHFFHKASSGVSEKKKILLVAGTRFEIDEVTSISMIRVILNLWTGSRKTRYQHRSN